MGSSGPDGVEVNLPAQGRWDAEWQPLDQDGSAPKGAYMQEKVIGMVGGAVQVLGTVTTTKTGAGQYGVVSDFSGLGASTYTLDAYDGAKLLVHLTNQPNALLISSSLNFDVHIECCPFIFEITWRGGGSSGTLLTLADGSSVQADRVTITPENGKAVTGLASVEVRTSGIAQIHFVPPQPAATSVTYQGLQYAALGLAALTLQTNGTDLLLDNLGSSGQDGVAVSLPAQGRWDAEWQPLDQDGSAPKGAYMQEKVIGMVGGAVQVLGTVTTTKAGAGQYGVVSDFSGLGATTYTLDAYDGAKLLVHLTNQPNALLISSSLNFDVHIECCPFIWEITWRGGGSSGTLLTLADGSSVQADRVTITPENGKAVTGLASVEVRTSGISQIHFVPPQPAATSVTYQGLQYAALGLATLTLQNNGTDLLLDNLGSSGQDGVAVSLPAQGRWDAEWQPLDQDGSAPKGAYMQEKVIGMVGGAVQVLGTVTTTKAGAGQYGVVSDFSGLGASTYTLDAY